MPFMQVGQGFHVWGRRVVAWRPAARSASTPTAAGRRHVTIVFAPGEDGARRVGR
jgi:hypothetical protein